MITLKSEQLQLQIKEAGAELCSVKNNLGMEYIWQARQEIWPRHAPVLFPIVGRLKSDRYIAGDKTFTLGQHGFARDMGFTVASVKKDAVVLQLSSTDQTLEKYPYTFLLSIAYQLHNNELHTSYTVTNTGRSAMFFSIGAHPGFRIPLKEEEQFEDYFLEFPSSEFRISLLQDGLRSGQQSSLNLTDRKLQLNAALFAGDALVFENGQVNAVTLKSGKSGHGIEVNCANWPCFGVWSKKDCREFVCLEPWYGIADKITASGRLSEKEGIIQLAPTGSFECSYTTRFF